MRPISILGAREHNLTGFDLDIPKERLVVFTGRSGSGKSSLVFDTVGVESVRQLNETYPLFIRHKLPRYERPDVHAIENLTPAVMVDQRAMGTSSRSNVATVLDIAPLLRLLYSRVAKPSAGVATAYSANSPRGMCPTCRGLGEVVALDLDKLLDPSRSLNEGAIRFRPWATHTWQWRLYGNSGFFDNDKPLRDFDRTEWHNLLHGSGRKLIIENDPSGVWYEGVADRFERLYLNKDSSKVNSKISASVEKVISISPCGDCGGTRLNDAARASRIEGVNIAELFAMELVEVRKFLTDVDGSVGSSLVRQIHMNVQRAIDVGLGYLRLDHSSTALSGGESQRLKLVRFLGSSLSGMTYILDEPSTGLHPHDITLVIDILEKLRDRGNTVLVVDHDAAIIERADVVIDIGPGAGVNGGRVVYQGSVDGLIGSGSITGRHLRKPVQINGSVSPPTDWIRVERATQHNLKNVDARIPLRAFTVVTGVSGAGKSSLVFGALADQHPGAVVFDQREVGASPRSTLATYLGIMNEIRKQFATTSGASPSLFSSNSEGACPNCNGRGTVNADMVYAEPVTETCEECGGLRYSVEALRHTYNGYSITDVMQLTVTTARSVFQSRAIDHKLETMERVGLSYLTLGQSTDTLSGGERHRLKLASRMRDEATMFLFDEPTSGLHMADVEELLVLMRALVTDGHSVVVVEHDPTVVAAADWVIDLGPSGGRQGGYVQFQGTPHDLLNEPKNSTAMGLRARLHAG